MGYSRIKRHEWGDTNGLGTEVNVPKFKGTESKKKEFKLERKWFCNWIYYICWVFPKTRALIPHVTTQYFGPFKSTINPHMPDLNDSKQWIENKIWQNLAYTVNKIITDHRHGVI